jgi:hypothetical protein
MKFLCVVFVDETKMAALSRNEAQALDDASIAYDQALQKSGHLMAAQALKPARTAATIKVRQDKVLITDGPFAETKEQVGGFLLIEARDRDEAIQLMSKVPVASYGTIEVRPVQELVASHNKNRSAGSAIA